MRKVIETNARRLKLTGKDGAERVEKDDIMAGLTAIVTVRIPEPQFEGQTKEVLGTAPVRQIVSKVVEKELGAILSSTKRDTKAQTAIVLEKIVAEMRARVAARKQKEISRRKNALETSSLPAKLADCRTNDVDKSELFIVEGDRKSTRLNSSHVRISYAVFCLKKKSSHWAQTKRCFQCKDHIQQNIAYLISHQIISLE